MFLVWQRCSGSSKPLVDGCGQEPFDVDSPSAYQQCAIWPVGGLEVFHSLSGGGRPSAFDFDCCQSFWGSDHEIDFPVAVTPVVDLALACGGGVGEMCADRRLHEPSPGLMISAGPVESDPFPGGDQGSVQDLEFGTGGTAADGA